MSSSLDAGYYADQAYREKQQDCKNSPSKEHEWVKHGSWPSIWEECKHCKKKIYWK